MKGTNISYYYIINTNTTLVNNNLVPINKSILTSHLQEPELWVHHLDASPIKTQKHEASNSFQLLPSSKVQNFNQK